VRIDDLAAEFSTVGRERFLERYGRHFLVFTEADLLDDVALFVNTASREGNEITRKAGLATVDVRALKKKPKSRDPARITVGRDQSCDIAIAHARVSTLHAVFTLGGGLVFITDAGSKNGTRVNGVKLKPNQPTPVDAGDTVLFGPVSATLWGADDVFAALR
jgi:hypothetical protein